MIKNYFFLMLLLGIGFLGVRGAFVKSIRQYFDARMYLSVAVILAVGFLVHNALLLMLLAGAALLINVSSRTDAICRLAILVALLPNVDQYITIGGLNLTTMSMPVILSLVALIACYARNASDPYRKWTAEDWLVTFLIICFGVTAERLANFTGLQRTTFSMLSILGLSYFVYRRFLPNSAEFGQLIAALAGAALILAFFAICEAKMHWALYDSIYSNQSNGIRTSMNMKMRGGLLRAPASFSDCTALGMFEMVGVFAIIASRQLFRNRLMWLSSVALTVLGMLAAQSRGADLGLMFGLFVMMVVRRRYAAAAAAAVGAAALVALALTLAPSVPAVSAFIGAGKTAGADQDYRQTLLRRGIQVGMEHPIIGNDMSLVIAEMSDITQGEGLVDLVNTYLNIFLASGLVGLGISTGLLATIFYKIFAADGSGRNQSFNDLQIFVAGAMSAGWFAFGFTSFLNERNGYWMMILLAGCRALANEARTSPSQAPRAAGQIARMPGLETVHRWQVAPIPKLG